MIPRLAFALACAGLAFARAPAAFADDPVRECVAAHAEGQELQNQGRILAAQAKFAECLAERCPALVREDCAALERALVAAMPSVVFEAIDVDGQPTAEVVVSVDGGPATFRLDGRPVPLEPGSHRFRFQRADGTSRELSLALGESERQRRVVADFRPPPAEVNDSSSTARTAIIVSGSVAAVALGSFTYFALSGKAIQSELDACKPNCPDPGELDRMQTRYLVADISLGVALVSLGVGAYVWLKNPTAFAEGRTRRASRFALGFSPARTADGFSLSAQGDF